MAKEKNNFTFAMIAIVAIVAIVGIVTMFINVSSVRYSTGTSATDENTLGSAAMSSACTDSDGGKNYYLKGTAAKGTSKSTDYCLSGGKRLVEYYCASSKITSVTYDCSLGGKICSNGICTKQDSPGSNISICTNGQTRICGTDVGECVAGTQTCANGVWSSCIGGVNPVAEVCDGKDNDCDGMIDEGCSWCNDTDGGNYPLVKGTTVSGNHSQTDYCSNSNLLIENYCNSVGGISATTVDCAYSYNGTCSNGACIIGPLCGNGIVEQGEQCDDGNIFNGDGCDSLCRLETFPCTDSDGGRNYYVVGITQGKTPAGYFTNSTDYCVDSTILEEYYCYNNLVYDYRYTCPYGCNNGACKSASWCNDTDGGKNYYVKGTAYTESGLFADACICYDISADLNSDGIVDVADLVIVTSDLGKTSGFNNPKSDINSDGIVDSQDLLIVQRYMYCSGLREYYCEVSLAKSVNYVCLTNCSNGACV